MTYQSNWVSVTETVKEARELRTDLAGQVQVSALGGSKIISTMSALEYGQAEIWTWGRRDICTRTRKEPPTNPSMFSALAGAHVSPRPQRLAFRHPTPTSTTTASASSKPQPSDGHHDKSISRSGSLQTARIPLVSGLARPISLGHDPPLPVHTLCRRWKHLCARRGSPRPAEPPRRLTNRNPRGSWRSCTTRLPHRQTPGGRPQPDLTAVQRG